MLKTRATHGADSGANLKQVLLSPASAGHPKLWNICSSRYARLPDADKRPEKHIQNSMHNKSSKNERPNTASPAYRVPIQR